MKSKPTISEVVARSRSARRAFRSRRRRFAIGLCACGIATIPVSLSLAGVSGSDMVQAATNGAVSLADLLNQRSPGARTAAQLTKIKHARTLGKQAAAAVVPAERLAMLPPSPAKPDIAPIAPLLAGPAITAGTVPPLEIAGGSPPTLAGIVGSLPGSDVGGGGGGAGGGGTQTIPPETREALPPTPTSAVPEPATWAMMLTGFCLVGWRLRRRPAAIPKKRPA